MGESPSERVARELVPVFNEELEQVEEVWAEVVETAGPTPTARQVREVVQRPALEWSERPQLQVYTSTAL